MRCEYAPALTPLHTAVINEQLSQVEGMGLDEETVHAKADDDHAHATSLHFATQLQDAFVLMHLCKKGADPGFTDMYGRTAMHWLAQNRYRSAPDMMGVLLHRGGELSHLDHNQNTPLHIIARVNNFRLMDYLRHSDQLSAVLNTRNSLGKTPLLLSLESDVGSEEERRKTTSALLEAGSGLIAEDGDGVSPLHYLALDPMFSLGGCKLPSKPFVLQGKGLELFFENIENADYVNTFLDAGLDVRLVDSERVSLKQRLLDADNLSSYAILIAQKKVPEEAMLPKSHLDEVAAYGIAYRERHGEKKSLKAAFSLACERGDDRVAVTVAQRVKDKTKLQRALVEALEWGRDKVAAQMILEGVPFDQVDKNGLYPLHHAARGGCVKTLTLLVSKKKVDVNLATSVFDHRRTALMLATEGGMQESMDLLLVLRASVRQLDTRGRSVFHYLARYPTERQKENFAKFLSAYNGLKVQDIEGLSPVDIARKNGNEEFVALAEQALGSDGAT